MSEFKDVRWTNLLAMSAPAFASAAAPAYGFSTRVLAQLRAEKENRELVERIGLRALLAALALLMLTAGLTLRVDHLKRSDFDPGVRSLIQLDRVKVS